MTIKPLIDKAVGELQTRNAQWLEFSIVWNISSEGKANNSWGYWFASDESEPEAFAVRPRTVRDELTTYLDELYPDGSYPIRILVQFNRDSNRYNVEFEDSNKNRWKISPANFEQAREELRPNLG